MWVAAVKLSTAPYANAMNRMHPILMDVALAGGRGFT